MSSATTRLRTHFPSHLYRLRTVSKYFNFTGVVKNVFLCIIIICVLFYLIFFDFFICLYLFQFFTSMAVYLGNGYPFLPNNSIGLFRYSNTSSMHFSCTPMIYPYLSYLLHEKPSINVYNVLRAIEWFLL